MGMAAGASNSGALASLLSELAPLCGSCCWCGPGEGFFHALASFPSELAPLCGSCCWCGPEDGFFHALASFLSELAPLCGSCCWCRPGKGFSMLWPASSQSSRCLRQLLRLPETGRLLFYGLRICFLGLRASLFSSLSISCPDSHCLGAPNQNTRSQYYPR